MRTRYQLRVSHAQICPRSAAGKRCLAFHSMSRPCLCQRYHHLLDHGRAWLTVRGQHVVSGEPYDLDAEDFQEFARELRDLDLIVTVEPFSPWNPGHSRLLLVRRPGTLPEADSVANA